MPNTDHHTDSSAKRINTGKQPFDLSGITPPPGATASVITNNHRSRSNSNGHPRRERSHSREANSRANVIFGTKAVTGGDIPTVEVVKTSKIFVSRICPGFSAENMWSNIQPKLSHPLTVHRMKTKYDNYSSFILVIREEDSAILLNPNSWAQGTLILQYDKPLPRHRIDSTYRPVVTGNPFIGSPPASLNINTIRAEQQSLPCSEPTQPHPQQTYPNTSLIDLTNGPTSSSSLVPPPLEPTTTAVPPKDGQTPPDKESTN